MQCGVQFAAPVRRYADYSQQAPRPCWPRKSSIRSLHHPLPARTEGLPVDRDWLDQLIEDAFADIPDELDADRLEAWLELASLASDEHFLTDLRQPAQGSLTAGAGRRYPHTWHASMMTLLDAAAQALWKSQDLDTFFRRVSRMVRDGGFALVTGEPGTGNSIASRQLAHHLAQTPDSLVRVLARPQSSLADFYRELGHLFAAPLIDE